MGIFGGSKAELQQNNPTENLSAVSQPVHTLSKKEQQLKNSLLPSINQLDLKMIKDNDQKQLAVSLIIMQQNELIIKYLDDISKKLDKSE